MLEPTPHVTAAEVVTTCGQQVPDDAAGILCNRARRSDVKRAPYDLRAQIRICEASRKQRLGDLLAPMPIRQQPARNGDIAGVERSDLHPNHRTGRPGSPCSASRMNCSTDRAGELGGPSVVSPWASLG